jgi:hypothetical protein
VLVAHGHPRVAVAPLWAGWSQIDQWLTRNAAARRGLATRTFLLCSMLKAFDNLRA